MVRNPRFSCGGVRSEARPQTPSFYACSVLLAASAQTGQKPIGAWRQSPNTMPRDKEIAIARSARNFIARNAEILISQKMVSSTDAPPNAAPGLPITAIRIFGIAGAGTDLLQRDSAPSQWPKPRSARQGPWQADQPAITPKAVRAAINSGELPTAKAGSMSYMLSKRASTVRMANGCRISCFILLTWIQPHAGARGCRDHPFSASSNRTSTRRFS